MIFQMGCISAAMGMFIGVLLGMTLGKEQLLKIIRKKSHIEQDGWTYFGSPTERNGK